MIEKSEKTDQIAAALAKAQGAMTIVNLKSIEPPTSAKFAGLVGLWDAIRAPLAENNLSIVQSSEQTDAEVLVSTILLHSSGQWILSPVAVRLEKRDAPAVRSALSYARHYGLAAMIGAIGDDPEPPKEEKPSEPVAPEITPAAETVNRSNVADFNQAKAASEKPKHPTREDRGRRYAQSILNGEQVMQKRTDNRYGECYELDYLEDNGELSTVRIGKDEKGDLTCNCSLFKALLRNTNLGNECEHIIAWKIVQRHRVNIEKAQTA